MAYLCVNKNGDEIITEDKPIREGINYKFGYWLDQQWTEGESYNLNIELPYGTIEKIIGYSLTWEDEPVEIK